MINAIRGKFGINPTYGFSERPFKVFLYSKMNADLQKIIR